MTEEVVLTNPSQEHVVTEYVTYEQKEAGFWMRFWAFLIDLLVVSAITGILIKPLFKIMEWDVGGTAWYAPVSLLSVAIYYAYFVLMTKFYQQTLGKMVFGLKVIAPQMSNGKLSWGTTIFRELVGRIISNSFFHLPYLIVAIGPEHKGVHDYVADTIVVHEESFLQKRRQKNRQAVVPVEQVASENEAPIVLEKAAEVIEQPVQPEGDSSKFDK